MNEVKRIRESARAYEEEGDYASAAKLWSGIKHYRSLCECLLKLGSVEEVRRIAKERRLNDILAETWKDKNKWVAKSIYERNAKSNSKTFKERVRAHASSPYVIGTTFLETCLTKEKLITLETKEVIKKVLIELYNEETASEHYFSDPRDGGGSMLDYGLIEWNKERINKLLGSIAD